MSNTIIHKHSSVVENSKPKLPNKDILEYGELAVNYAKDNETISLKNTSNEIIEFKSKNYFEKIIEDNELVVASALNNLNDKIQNIDTSYPIVQIEGEEQLMAPNTYYIANNKKSPQTENSISVSISAQNATISPAEIAESAQYPPPYRKMLPDGSASSLPQDQIRPHE